MTTPQDPFAAPGAGDQADGRQPGSGAPQSGTPEYGTRAYEAPPYGAPAYGPPGYGGYPAAPRTETRAIIALVCAIVSVVFPLVPAIVALVLASSSSRQIAASGGMLTGEGLNTASKIIAWISIGFSVVVVVGLVGLLTFGVGAGGVSTDVGGY